MSVHQWALLLGALLTVGSQLVLKHGALVSNRSTRGWRRFLNRYVALGYFLFFLVTLTNLYGLKEADLLFMALVNPLTYLLVILLSIAIFREPTSPRQRWGIGLVLAGVVMMGLAQF